ncbi:MAG: aldehyde dehydrogenase family protein [Proteobacteria bacterium]|nr:aldehyde dehydrogenase family protein [Pseudomonadota bacterium]
MIPAELRAKIPEHVSSYVDGEFVAPRGNELPVIYPATEEQVSTLYEADAATVDQAVQAARRSLDSGVWRNLDVAERQRIFARVKELTREHLEELALLETVNTGQAINYTRNAQLPRIFGNFTFFAEYMGQATEKAAFEDKRMLRYTTRHPLGVVALISSSNAPTALASTKIAAALCHGNSCVVKTSENTPLALARFMQILTEAGVPPGVVNLVNGRGEVTGDALVDHPLVNGVSFTGGNVTAGRIAARAAPVHKRIDLELGGKSANIVMPSADLDLAVTAALVAIYTNNGQQCFAGSRIVLHRAIADRFIEQFVARANRIRVGDPFDPGTQNGPLAFRRHYDRVLSYIDVARADGAELLAGGGRPDGLEQGLYVRPTAFLAPGNSARICQEEVFGPIASFLIVDSIDEAIAVANDSAYGLVSYVWSNDQREVLAASHAIQAGLVMVNTPLLSLDTRMPFGGFKQSGIGREGAEGARAFYTEEKTVAIALQPPRLPPIGLD